MSRQLKKLSRESSGFTLIEIVIVVIIIGVIAGIAIVGLGGSQKNSLQQSCKTNYKTLIAAITIYQNDHAGDLPKNTNGDLSLEPLSNTSPPLVAAGLLDFQNYSFTIQPETTAVGYSIHIVNKSNQPIPDATTAAPEACSSL